MRKIVQLKQCLLFALALIGAPGISAAQQPSALKRLEGGTPVLEVVKAWHKALLVGDFDAYLRTTSTTFVPGQTSPYAFGQLRRYLPQEAERVNDFATPGDVNLVCGRRVHWSVVAPVLAG